MARPLWETFPKGKTVPHQVTETSDIFVDVNLFQAANGFSDQNQFDSESAPKC
jgi:hypothetical protein